MKSPLALPCDVVVLAFKRRLRGFYAGRHLHAFVSEPPWQTLLSNLAPRKGRVLLIADYDVTLDDETRSGVRVVRIPSGIKPEFGPALALAVSFGMRAPICLIVDASAPYLTPETIGELVRKAKRADLVRLTDNGGALATTRDGLRRLVNVAVSRRSDNLWSWSEMAIGTIRTIGANAPRLLAESFAVRAIRERPLDTVETVYSALAEMRLAKTLGLVQDGLGLKDPASFELRGRLRFGRNVKIDAQVQIIGNVTLGHDVTIGPHCILEDVSIASGTEVKAFTLIAGSAIGPQCRVGPFARIRPGCKIGHGCHIGNYVELKGARMKTGCKINHHSFIGDAQLGENVIIGAGSVTCNYDGRETQRTTIGTGAFVGSGVMMIAPIRIGKGAFVAAGSTVSKRVPAGSLTIARAQQVSRFGWKKRKRLS